MSKDSKSSNKKTGNTKNKSSKVVGNKKEQKPGISKAYVPIKPKPGKKPKSGN